MSARPPIDVAYFSLEVMLESDIPTYAGGLGILAGDVLRSAADMHVPAVGVSLVYSGDYFIQLINLDGSQSFYRSDWQKLDQLQKLPTRIEMEIGGMPVIVGCWRHDIIGLDGFVVPVYLLDTNFMENPTWIRNFTINLYRSGGDVRICQELLLGVGGVKMLRALGYKNIKTFHLNEGHAAFTPLELLAENNYQEAVVKKMCVFTTHTPVPEGHDKFGYDLAWHYGRKYFPWHIRQLAGDDCLNMTRLAMNLSRVSFAVSEKHQTTSQSLFPGFDFDYVTNGIHHRSWTAPTMQNLFDKYLPDWLTDPSQLISAPDVLPDDELWAHHQDAKSKLVRYVNAHLTAISSPDELNNPLQNQMFDINTLTISLARRPVAYKRPLLLYHDIERFVRLGAGKLQIVQCGKSHPDDDISQEFVRQIVTLSKRFKDVLRIAFLRNYSPKLARVLVSGSDLWLNTPRRPLEASGTSGMKAAINGCLNFSVQDGWWIEGLRTNPLAGWPLGPADECANEQDCDAVDANDMYTQLEQEIIPMYYDHRPEWIARMKQAITLGSFFNTHRVVRQYQAKAWN